MKSLPSWLAAAGLLLAPELSRAQMPAPAPKATPAKADDRLAWWREAKFGLFIHWGVYSVPAGDYHGKPVKDNGEWIMQKAKIPTAEYQAFAREFNPVKFDAAAWVRAAKEAGMKYIVITAKHHDGFAMFRTAANRWNIVDATPFGRDPLKELADACRAQGMRLGFYYSQAQDWNNGGAAKDGHWDPAQDRPMDEYIDQVAVPQVRELLSGYGPDTPAILWWDTPYEMNPERAARLEAVVRELRPDLIQNNRLGGGVQGDTETPEQHIPAQGYKGRAWETCMTMNDTWGFKRDDNHWKSTEILLRNLCDIASKGGNYLLNVGPTSEGLIPQPSLDRLREVGAWMKTNGEAIYGTGPTPFGAEASRSSDTEKDRDGKPKVVPAWEWRCTTRPGKLYIHLFRWPADGRFVLPGLQSTVTKAYLLADAARTPLPLTTSENGPAVALPAQAPDAVASVLCVEIADPAARVAPVGK